jgi:hypothetical protein
VTTLPVLSASELIATAARPLRASALPRLLECAGRVLLTEEFWGLRMDDSEDSGAAAQTGSLVHAAAEAFHKGGDGNDAIEVFRGKYPKGDPVRARKIFAAYSADPKNKDAKIVALETKITYAIRAAPFDPTGEPVIVNGTLDQVREDSDGYRTVWDIKTGVNFYGTKALHHYAAQQALYTLAAGEDVYPGGLICTDGYFRPGGKVFFQYKVTRADMVQMLTKVAALVAFARMGQVIRTPGDVCEWCPHKTFEGCSSYVRDHVN